MKKHEKQLNELFEMWNKEHLENIALSEKVIELKIELANLKMQIHENSLQKGNKSRKEKKHLR